MGKKQTIIFFSVFFTIYFAVNYYIFIRGFQALELFQPARIVYSIIFWIVATSYIIGKFVERRTTSLFTDILIWIGSFWFAFILYYFLAIIGLDILRFINWVTGVVSIAPERYPLVKIDLFAGVSAMVIILVLYGYLNAKHIRIKRFDLKIDKANQMAKQLKIVAASDIHLGTIIGRKPTKAIIDAINNLKPDIILLPGDIIDSEVEPVVKQDLGAVLKELYAPYGVYGVTGNHEYIGGVEPAVEYIRAHQVDILRDEIRTVAGITIVGREDRSAGQKRKTLAEIMKEVDRTKPVVLMDHQPFKLEEAETEGVDLQLSGHTHRGQLWPLSYITKKIYEIDWGYLLKGKTHYYVSSGVGTWGPPTKIGNDAEIIELNLSFQ